MSTSPSPATSLSEESLGLYRLAQQAAAHAYAPYSQFRVGAALLLVSGETVVAANVENASYRLTCCAEQSAVVRAVAEHGPQIRLRAVAVANLNNAASTPCGACRQTLAEFGEDATLIIYPDASLTPVQTTLGELVPHTFRLSPLP